MIEQSTQDPSDIDKPFINQGHNRLLIIAKQLSVEYLTDFLIRRHNSTAAVMLIIRQVIGYLHYNQLP